MGKGKGGSNTAPYQNELAGMFAGQQMMNMAARNPNAAQMFRPGSELGDAYKDMFGTNALPAQQRFEIPNLGISQLANERVFGGMPQLSLSAPMNAQTALGGLPQMESRRDRIAQQPMSQPVSQPAAQPARQGTKSFPQRTIPGQRGRL